MSIMYPVVKYRTIDASAYVGPGGGSQFEGDPLPDASRLGSSFSRCAPAATNPKGYAVYTTPPVWPQVGGHHTGSLQELPHTVCDPVVPLLVAFYNPGSIWDGYPIPPHPS
jgi:hypothetical protein